MPHISVMTSLIWRPDFAPGPENPHERGTSMDQFCAKLALFKGVVYVYVFVSPEIHWHYFVPQGFLSGVVGLMQK